MKDLKERVLCACGCGNDRLRFDKSGTERRYILGHHARTSKHGRGFYTCRGCSKRRIGNRGVRWCNDCRTKSCACGCGTQIHKDNKWVPGHHWVGRKHKESTKGRIATAGVGRTATKATREKRSRSLAKFHSLNPNKHPRFVQGDFVSPAGVSEHYDSSYELKRMEQLTALGVDWTKKHGLVVPYTDEAGMTRNYVPDFLCRLAGDEWVEEIKPNTMLFFGNNQLKFAAARVVFNDFRIITEDVLFSGEAA